MLKNKIIVRKIRNIVMLIMAMAIMVGTVPVYTNPAVMFLLPAHSVCPRGLRWVLPTACVMQFSGTA